MLKKMKNIEMVNAVNGLNEFVRKDKIVPVTLSVAISANIKNMLRELEPYEEERKKILDDESKNAEERFRELCDCEVDINIREVPADTLEGVGLSTKDYMSLEFMLE